MLGVFAKTFLSAAAPKPCTAIAPASADPAYSGTTSHGRAYAGLGQGLETANRYAREPAMTRPPTKVKAWVRNAVRGTRK